MKRVVIIGSGLGGLTTGVTLAKNGYRVTVVEQGARVGGCLQCFSRHGVKFETGMHFVGSADEGQVLRRLTRYLEIDTKLRLSRLDTRRYYVVGLRGRRFEFANGREAFIERMAEDFPQEKDNLRRYMDVVGQVAAASSRVKTAAEAPCIPFATAVMRSTRAKWSAVLALWKIRRTLRPL